MNTQAMRDAQARALVQLEHLVASFGAQFPDDTTRGRVYALRRAPGSIAGANVGWTTGFWTGMGWLAYELSGRFVFRQWAQSHYASFARRMGLKHDLDHHDMGFLYGPSSLAAYRITGDPRDGALVLHAADVLLGRFLPRAGVFQAWGRMGEDNARRDRNRIIIDTLMNLPLLHWAGRQTGDARYGDAACRHLARTLELLVRADGSSAHSSHIDPLTGAQLAQSTVQGHAADSCWARGQAWGIYGFALNHRFAPDMGLLDAAQRMADYLLAHMPDDGVCQWDLALARDGSVQRDSSASAIAVCGLLELAQQMPDGARRTRYEQAAAHMLDGLVRTCTAPPAPGAGLLQHGVYSLPEGRGVDEANLWGDYYFLEALARVNMGWTSYWHSGREASGQAMPALRA
ncbi:glucuronyl hydrolase [Duganella sp. FT92W]|uniref:Glucuronyl hydrolase n=1 Tax=Pseudoduganella rivuli TaxID=2666085 RepID=A0A7X2LPH5_9BURK|nr:glycoside hydrolase family 88 protein [Pseudoduganella rivuli]MRV70260.1 glucuronyl hydrolase [Pseudoduganella rivuli]